MLTPEQQIEEAHGVWELCVARIAALVEAEAKPGLLKQASLKERDAFDHWRLVSNRATY